MFWWVAGAAVGVAVKLIYDIVSEEERDARQRWEKKRDEVQCTVVKRRRRLSNHLQRAQDRWDFHNLVEEHFSSMMVANAAWKTLQNARSSLRTVARLRTRTWVQVSKLQKKINMERDWHRRGELIEEIKVLRQMLADFNAELGTLQSQEQGFYHELCQLNEQTRLLKEAVRDRCGSRGRSWYKEREARKNRHHGD